MQVLCRLNSNVINLKYLFRAVLSCSEDFKILSQLDVLEQMLEPTAKPRASVLSDFKKDKIQRPNLAECMKFGESLFSFKPLRGYDGQYGTQKSVKAWHSGKNGQTLVVCSLFARTKEASPRARPRRGTELIRNRPPPRAVIAP